MRWVIIQDGDNGSVAKQLNYFLEVKRHTIGRIIPLHTDEASTGAILLVELDPLSEDVAEEVHDLTDTLSDAALELRKELDAIKFGVQSIKDALLEIVS